MTFGENLKTLRNTRSISQKDLAVELGFSFQNISKWERNESLPDIGTLIEIAKFFLLRQMRFLGSFLKKNFQHLQLTRMK